MKALSLVLPRHLPLAKPCTRLKGHEGLKGAVRQLQAQFALKTDAQAFCASIDHHPLLLRLAAQITDPQVLHLIAQYMQRCAERGGLYWELTQGIPLGCPLSPIMGAFFLTELDAALAALGLFDV